MSRQPRSLFDELLELAVYVPAGLASKVLEQVPDLAEAGRRRVGGQVDQARVIGRFAVGLARSQARRTFGSGSRPSPRARPSEPEGRAEPERRAEPEGRAGSAGRAEPASAPPSSSTRAGAAPAGSAGSAGGRVREASKPRPASEGSRATAPGSGGDPPAPPQAIADYDALAASQVVPRLQGLDREELAAVEAYEAATRRRRTILNRTAQLLRALDER